MYTLSKEKKRKCLKVKYLSVCVCVCVLLQINQMVVRKNKRGTKVDEKIYSQLNFNIVTNATVHAILNKHTGKHIS